MLTTKGIRLYNAPNSVSVETPRGIRLAKQKTSRKVDAAVALSFGVLAAIQNGKPPTEADYANSPAANWKPEDSEFNPYTGKAYH